MRYWLLGVLCCCLAVSSAADRSGLSRLVESLPVQHEGRIKPLASMARAWLLAVHTRSSLRLDDDRRSATAWLMELLCDQQAAFALPVFTERNPAVIQALGLETNARFAYSFDQLAGAFNKQGEMLAALQERPRDGLDVTERELLRLLDVVQAYYGLAQSMTVLLPMLEPGPELCDKLGLQPGRYSYREIRQRSGPLALVVKDTQGTAPDNLSALELQALALGRHMQALEQHGGHGLSIFPPASGEGAWLTPWQLAAQPRASDPQLVDAWQQLAQAWLEADGDALASAVNDIKTTMATEVDNARLEMEVQYLQIGWYTWAKVCYILGLAAVGIALLGSDRWPRLLAVSLVSGGLLLHWIGIAMRIYILQRPPVSTLYESIIFVAAVAGLACLGWEWLRRDGLAVFVAGFIACVLLFVADAYADDGDTMGMLQAVLNSRMWLTIHVLTIAVGYSTALIAGVVGHCYLIAAALWPGNKPRLRSIEMALHGIALVALFFVLSGTILGGIWADQSWGRFWGWDPKENGALWIVLWILMLLHMRLSGQAPIRIYAAGMVVLNAVVALAWFGVNLLGVGLHSYGFSDSVVTNLLLFVLVELLLAAGLWLLAEQRWRGHQAQPAG